MNCVRHNSSSHFTTFVCARWHECVYGATQTKRIAALKWDGGRLHSVSSIESLREIRMFYVETPNTKTEWSIKSVVTAHSCLFLHKSNELDMQLLSGNWIAWKWNLIVYSKREIEKNVVHLTRNQQWVWLCGCLCTKAADFSYDIIENALKIKVKWPPIDNFVSINGTLPWPLNCSAMTGEWLKSTRRYSVINLEQDRIKHTHPTNHNDFGSKSTDCRTIIVEKKIIFSQKKSPAVKVLESNIKFDSSLRK